LLLRIAKKPELRSELANALDGSCSGLQPKPAVEVIIVAMKPLSEKTYVDQALKNGKGITWLDDCSLGTEQRTSKGAGVSQQRYSDSRAGRTDGRGKNLEVTVKGRFPAHLLVSEDVVNDGQITKGHRIDPALLF